MDTLWDYKNQSDPHNLWDTWVDLLVCWVQRAKNVVSGSPGLVDLAVGLVNSVINLPDGQVNFWAEIQITEEL